MCSWPWVAKHTIAGSGRSSVIVPPVHPTVRLLQRGGGVALAAGIRKRLETAFEGVGASMPR
jgi:hypothetical protein